MAITERNGTTWHHGGNPNSWRVPTSYVYTGNGVMARLTMGGARIDNIGPITQMRIYIDTVNSSSNGGPLYVSNSSSLLPDSVAGSAKKIGDWATPNGNAQWITISNFSGANLISGVGTSTTWYLYFINNITVSRSMFSPTVYPKIELTHEPGLVYIFDGSSWKLGQPYIFDGSSWKLGQAYVFDGSAWKIGIG